MRGRHRTGRFSRGGLLRALRIGGVWGLKGSSLLTFLYQPTSGLEDTPDSSPHVVLERSTNQSWGWPPAATKPVALACMASLAAQGTGTRSDGNRGCVPAGLRGREMFHFGWTTEPPMVPETGTARDCSSLWALLRALASAPRNSLKRNVLRSCVVAQAQPVMSALPREVVGRKNKHKHPGTGHRSHSGRRDRQIPFKNPALEV